MLVYLPMIKYLVMGIKTYIKRHTCPQCKNGVLLPFSWKTCQLHDPQRRKLTLVKSEVKESLYSQLIFKCDKEKALESEELIYDENMHIIGYKSHLFKLKV